MATETVELDRLQKDYQAAVEAWITAIRKEEALASSEYSVAELDHWEDAACDQERVGYAVKEAKRRYEDALREKFFNF